MSSSAIAASKAASRAEVASKEGREDSCEADVGLSSSDSTRRFVIGTGAAS